MDAEFDLNDKFGDAEELKSSWRNMGLPTLVGVLFSMLFNSNQAKLMTLQSEEVDDLDDPSDYNTNDKSSSEKDYLTESKKSLKPNVCIR